MRWPRKSPSRHIGWNVASLSPEMASVRYRALLPILALQKQGYSGTVLAGASDRELDKFEALVIVKNFNAESYRYAQRAQRRGLPVILDLCDNIFIDSYGKKGKTRIADMFLAVAGYADAIVATTEPLAQVIRQHVGPDVPVHVVPDAIESGKTLKASRRLLLAGLDGRTTQPLADALVTVRELLQFRRLRRPRTYLQLVKAWTRANQPRLWAYVRRLRHGSSPTATPLTSADASTQEMVDSRAHAPYLNILWFGNHGAPHARFGMLDLLDIRDALEQIARELPARLVVISNNREKFDKHIHPLGIPTTYVPWSSDAVAHWMRKSKVAVIPNSLDAFSICKSANRTVHALMHGVPVVATSTPSLAPLAPSIVLDDFLGGLRRYMKDEKLARRDVARGQALAEQHFGLDQIGTSWRKILEDTAMASRQRKPTHKEPQLAVVLHLIQDLDLALPVIVAAKARGIEVHAWASMALLKKSPRVFPALRSHGVELVALQDDVADGPPEFNSRLKAVLTVAETNLGPHRFTRSITDLARQAGVFTATMQHGLENVGLTYSDDVHHIQKIDFAADRIYIWGPLATLHPQVGAATRLKCVSVGCVKPAREPIAKLKGLLPEKAIVVGVFENLHWHRYSDGYRHFFLEGVTSLARKFPEVVFLVKPHHAGLWLTSRFKGERPTDENVVIADPRDLAWEAHTAGSLMGHMNAVITTPSTVAMDAARHGLPVAVVAYDMDLPNYAPLPLLRRLHDWEAFVRRSLDPDTPSSHPSLSEQYVSGMIRPGDAATRIISDLFGPEPQFPGNS